MAETTLNPTKALKKFKRIDDQIKSYEQKIIHLKGQKKMLKDLLYAKNGLLNLDGTKPKKPVAKIRKSKGR